MNQEDKNLYIRKRYVDSINNKALNEHVLRRSCKTANLLTIGEYGASQRKSPYDIKALIRSNKNTNFIPLVIDGALFIYKLN